MQDLNLRPKDYESSNWPKSSANSHKNQQLSTVESCTRSCTWPPCAGLLHTRNHCTRSPAGARETWGGRPCWARTSDQGIQVCAAFAAPRTISSPCHALLQSRAPGARGVLIDVASRTLVSAPSRLPPRSRRDCHSAGLAHGCRAPLSALTVPLNSPGFSAGTHAPGSPLDESPALTN